MNKKRHITVINGPNLNLLGKREPEIYGSKTLDKINAEIKMFADKNKYDISFFQSNHEGKIIDIIHDTMDNSDGIIINPGAFTHYSYAIYDAIVAVGLPTIEIHISDIHSREEFRKISVIKPACKKQISGRGWQGYIEAVRELISILDNDNE